VRSQKTKCERVDLREETRYRTMSGGTARMFVQMWTHRVMIAGLVRRDIRSRYAGSVLGILWTVLHPLLLLLVYFFVFSTILQIKFTPEGGSSTFALYLLAGLLPWLAFQEGVMRAATAVVDNAGLVKSIHFPAVVLVSSSVFASAFTLVLSLGMLVLAFLVMGTVSWGSVPYLLLLVCVQVVLAFGCGLVTASMHTFLRDTLPVLQMIFMLWFYVTPIIYPLSYVPSRFVTLFAWNPFTPLVTAYRAVLIEGKSPVTMDLLPTYVWVVLCVSLGWFIFSRLEPGFADVL
jgi:lipopolysaccharide transport system permease protein